MKEYQFDIRYTASTYLSFEAESLEAAKEQIYEKLSMSIPLLDYYDIKESQEAPPKPTSIAHFACGLQLEDEDE